MSFVRWRRLARRIHALFSHYYDLRFIRWTVVTWGLRPPLMKNLIFLTSQHLDIILKQRVSYSMPDIPNSQERSPMRNIICQQQTNPGRSMNLSKEGENYDYTSRITCMFKFASHSEPSKLLCCREFSSAYLEAVGRAKVSANLFVSSVDNRDVGALLQRTILETFMRPGR